jgi:hypothetical protein
LDSFGTSAAASKNEPDSAGIRGRQRQPPGGGQADVADFSDHAGKPRMAQSFFRRLQGGILLAGLYMDDAIRLQANAGQARGKKIRALQHPHNRTAQASENARDEQGRGTGMFYFWPPHW